MSQKKTQTSGATQLAVTAQGVGDKLNDKFNETGDLRVATIALKAYNTSLRTYRDIMAYKRHTGKPSIISFYEN